MNKKKMPKKNVFKANATPAGVVLVLGFLIVISKLFGGM